MHLCWPVNGAVERHILLIMCLNNSYPVHIFLQENSSIPPSKFRKPKKIANSREKTGRKPGAQPGHEVHHRKRQEPTSSHKLPPPQEVLDDPDFRPTGKTKSKQMVSIELRLVVNEPELIWSSEMHYLVQEMIHYRNSLPNDEEPNSDKVADFEKRYDEAVAKACEEYSD